MRQLHQRFVWTHNGLSRLYDSIDTPASCWVRAFDNPPLKDDCDGYHAALYWAVSIHFTCRLLTLITSNIKDSHTVLIIRVNGYYYLANYTYLSKPLTGIDDVISDLFATYYKHKKGIKVLAWQLYNWEGNRWQTESSEK